VRAAAPEQASAQAFQPDARGRFRREDALNEEQKEKIPAAPELCSHAYLAGGTFVLASLGSPSRVCLWFSTGKLILIDCY
jgi:hypothetical protein